MNTTVCIVVGHSRSSKGVRSVSGVSEWDYNDKVADHLRDKMLRQNVSTVKLHRETTISELVSRIKKVNPVVVVELHFNSVESPQANGAETLYLASNEKGRQLAVMVQRRTIEILKNRDRGVLPISKGGRGFGLLSGVDPIPAIITEPFFGSNPTEWHNFHARWGDVADTVYHGVMDYLLIFHPKTVPLKST